MDWGELALNLLFIVAGVIECIMIYDFWQLFRPDMNTRIKGISACKIYDIVWLVIAAAALVRNEEATLIFCLLLIAERVHRKQDEQIVLQRNKMIDEEYQRLNEMNMEMQYLRHDWKNHLLAIRSMAESERYEDLKDYLGDLEEALGNRNSHIISGNSIVDVILKQKTDYAKKQGIRTEISCADMKELKLTEKDMCIILANLYDNAIEAAKEAAVSPWITIKIVRNRDILMMKFSNSYLRKPRKRSGVFLSRKEDGRLHGYGLLSVRKVVEKYGGDLDTSFDEERFEACVIIYDGFGDKET